MAAKQQAPKKDIVEKFGRLDHITGRQLTGWAVDLQQSPKESVVLMLWGDDQPLGIFRCNEPRPDVNSHGFPGETPGFRLDLPEALLDGNPHRISVRFRSGEIVPSQSDSGPLEDEVRFIYHTTALQGMVDGMFGSAVRGWAFNTDIKTGQKTGSATLEVWSNGNKIGQVKADRGRNDVAEAMGCPPNCGFLYAVPPRFRDGKPFTVEFRPTSGTGVIGGSPYTGRVLIKDSVDQLHSVLAQVEELCTQSYALKDQLKMLLSADEHTLDDYHHWAVSYFNTLDERVTAVRSSAQYAELLGGQDIKVSILCPTYKPNLADFAQAVESVRRQSWSNWELVIVDDCSQSQALNEMIDGFTAADPRIRSVKLRKNQGISGATNAAIAAATGDWIALFDHDDLLVDVAIEVMLLAARNTGALMLYSDEDKISALGVYSEPHLKTDWNYRLLLTNNYVCHLLMVDAATLRAAGELNSKYDGAQDHDLILRLAEIVPWERIHHVPEILYHWRMTENSTAGQSAAKPYAALAGVNAVRDHLKRKGLDVDIATRPQTTIYDVRWQFNAEPAVTILIPFKDKLDMTRRCVERLVAVTEYKNYKVVLIDNWSTEPETLAWTASLSDDERIEVLRVEEPFNFSRLNNLAARRADTDLLLFMNNDIFVDQADWLRLMVDEMLADPTVGIVGAKLVYPNQTVQHAGVVLGVGGVGDHTFRSEERNSPGYMGRAVCSQEYSAVTAACLLCRADAFRAVGTFDEEQLSVAFNDVDLCLKIGRAGYRIVYTPAVVAEHHESISRGSDFAAHNLSRFYHENQLMMDRWGELIRHDPYYNPHFSQEDGMFRMLSSKSLDVARAPSLLARPVPRATLQNPPPLEAPAPVVKAAKRKATPKSKPAPAPEAPAPRKRQPARA